MDLLKKYGVYKIRKGTRLYRRSADTEHHEVMFFGFCKYATAGASYQSDIQIWESTNDFDALFMIKGKNYCEHLVSSVIDIYNDFFPQNKKEDKNLVDVKKTDNERRPLLNKLKENNINNWVCSVENLPPMELCIFESLTENQDLVKFLYSIPEDKEDELEGSDSFDRSNVEKLNLEYVVLNMNPPFDIIINSDDLLMNFDD